jgi:hypothetical protein
MLLFRRNSFYSPKLYIKESYIRRKERYISNVIMAAAGGIAGLLSLIAGLSLLSH